MDSSGPWDFLSIDGFCCVVREGSINYIILCERHEVEFTAEIRTIVLLCLASFFSLCLEGTYVVLKQDILCSAAGWVHRREVGPMEAWIVCDQFYAQLCCQQSMQWRNDFPYFGKVNYGQGSTMWAVFFSSACDDEIRSVKCLSFSWSLCLFIQSFLISVKARWTCVVFDILVNKWLFVLFTIYFVICIRHANLLFAFVMCSHSDLSLACDVWQCNLDPSLISALWIFWIFYLDLFLESMMWRAQCCARACFVMMGAAVSFLLSGLRSCDYLLWQPGEHALFEPQ